MKRCGPMVATYAAALMLLCGNAQSLRAEDQQLDAGAAANDGRSDIYEYVESLEKRVKELESRSMSDTPVVTDVEASGELPDADVDNMRKYNGDLFETHQLMTKQELISEDFLGSWPMFGNDMRIKLGGYVKADFVADFDGTRDPRQFLMRTIPVEGEADFGDDGYFKAFANETRFNMDVRRVKPGAPPLRAFIEGDFFTGDNSFRLRHAYMTVGQFTIGQTWTTLSFLETLPYVIDFAAGDALFGGRAAQIRYQRQTSERWKFSVALEDLSFVGIENPSNLPGKENTQFPQLAMRADYSWGSGLLLMGASVAQLHWDGGSAGPSDSAVQYAFVVGGRQNVGSNSYVTWNVAYGEGAGENIMAFAGTDANATLSPDGTLETLPAVSVVLGGGHNWTQTLSSNLAYAYGSLDTPDTRAPFALKRGGVGHVNLVWKPTTQFSVGAEFMWGVVRVENDALGKAQRMQFMGKYQF